MAATLGNAGMRPSDPEFLPVPAERGNSPPDSGSGAAFARELSGPAGSLIRMIRETTLDTVTDDDAPSGLLRLHLAGEAARMTWTPNPPPDVIPPPSYSFQVSARSLLLALRAAWGDGHPGSTDLDGVQPAKPRREPRPGPPNSRAPWVADLDAALREAWLAESSATPVDEVLGELAKRMGRSRGSIRARLARVGCDPDVPGRTLRDDPGDPDGSPGSSDPGDPTGAPE
jgi:hypothetical protein